MKKTLYLIVLPILIILFSSCLGSSDSTMSGGGFGYVKSYEDGTSYANIQSGYQYLAVTSPDIRKEAPGTCGYFQYSIRSNSIFKDNIFEAEHASITKNYKKELVLQWNPQVAEDQYMDSVVNLAITSSFASDALGDNWLLYFELKGYEQDRINIMAFYDEANQIDKDEKKVSYEEDGRIILDIKFDIERGKVEEGVKPVLVDKGYDFVVNLRNLRDELRSIDQTGFLGDDWGNKSAQIMFRFYKEKVTIKNDKELREKETKYLGEWIDRDNIIPTQSSYQMVFPAEKE